MIGVLVRLQFESEFSEARVRQIAANARSQFEHMPNLRSKVFTVDTDTREALNFYLWESEEAARAFFSPEFVEKVTGLYGAPPSVQFTQVAELVDNQHSETVRSS